MTGKTHTPSPLSRIADTAAIRTLPKRRYAAENKPVSFVEKSGTVKC